MYQEPLQRPQLLWYVSAIFSYQLVPFTAAADAFSQVSEAGDTSKDHEEDDLHEMELEDEVCDAFPCCPRSVCPVVF